MLKTLAAQVKQYKRAAILTPIFTSLEVVMDVLIPYVTAKLIDLGITAKDIQDMAKRIKAGDRIAVVMSTPKK